MVFNIRYSLCGVGQLIVANDGAVTGRQRSSTTPLQGQRAALRTGDYALSGRVTVQPDGTGEAVIHFKKTAGDGRDVDGKFFLQVAGAAGRIWLVSCGATSGGEPADEQVTIEAVRMSEPPAAAAPA